MNAVLSKYRKSLIWSAATTAICYFVALGMTVYLEASLSPKDSIYFVWGLLPIIAATFSFIQYWGQYSGVVNQVCSRTPSGCEYSFESDAFVMLKENGIGYRMPWGLIKMEKTPGDTWLVQTDEFGVSIDRIPMREAGLEEEFLRRIEIAGT
ncbi:hypothetical protein BH11ARM1_BH11ARM1_16530 [soil metagenome]